MIFTIGDGFAALIGARFGAKKWPWAEDKTMIGSLAFILTAFIAMLVFLSWAITDIPFYILLPMAFFSTLIGCYVEARPLVVIKDRKLDDNLNIILISGLVLYASVYFLGYSYVL